MATINTQVTERSTALHWENTKVEFGKHARHFKQQLFTHTHKRDNGTNNKHHHKKDRLHCNARVNRGQYSHTPSTTSRTTSPHREGRISLAATRTAIAPPILQKGWGGIKIKLIISRSDNNHSCACVRVCVCVCTNTLYTRKISLGFYFRYRDPKSKMWTL